MLHEECGHFMVNNVLLSPSNCHFSPTIHPLLGSAMWEKERDGGVERVSLAERSLSISQQAYSALHPLL